jgi:ABC-type bacteriocin/lantibiotic exporter with double-glycine peptidase domain
MRHFIALFRLLEPVQRRRLGLILFGITMAAIIDAAGVASIAPFLALVANSGSPAVMGALGGLRSFIGVTDATSFMILVGLLSLAVIVTSSLLNAWVTWAQLRFTYNIGFTVSRRLLASYLAKDQVVLLSRNSAEMGKNILSEVDRLVGSALLPAITLVSRIALAVCIVLILLVIEPVLALMLAVVLGSVYIVIYLVIKRRLANVGEVAMEGNKARFQAVAEVFAALRELRLYGRVSNFVRRFDAPALAYANAHAAALCIGQMPKFILEPLAFGSVILIVVYQIQSGGNLATAMPMIGLFAFAGYRLMPAFQNIFLAFSTLRFYLPVLEVVLTDLQGSPDRSDDGRAPERAPFAGELVLRDVAFSYGNGADVLDAINLAIKAKSSVGLIGRTGSGKTTLVSLILGLLSPTSGSIRVDGVLLQGATLIAWQRRIGYVPQDVFLTDDTIAANIALGIPQGEIDQAAVVRAARLANIHDFIAGLPGGYGTPVGERGARLSGGQRQRIGIARALYHDPDVVVFDEATSGLDTETEEAVMAAIDRLAGERTLIIIAHRPGALRRANVVHLVERGRIAASGTLKDLQPLLDLEGTAASAA